MTKKNLFAAKKIIYNSTLRLTLISAIISLLSSGLNFLLNVYIARTYSDDVFADYNYVISLYNILSVLFSFGLSQYLLINIPRVDTKEMIKIIGKINFISLFVSLFGYATISIFILDYDDFLTEILIVFIGVFFTFQLNRQSILFANEKVIVFQIIDKIIRLAMILFLINIIDYGNSDFNNLLLCVLGSYIFCQIFSGIGYKGLGLSKISISFNLGKDVYKNSFNLYGAVLIVVLMSNIDILILKEIGTIEELALFIAAQKIALLAGVVLNALTNVITPKLARNNKDKANNIRVSTLIGFFTILIFLIFTIIFGDFALHIFGEKYISSDMILNLMVFNSLLSAFFGQSLTLMKTENESAKLTKYLFIAVIIKILISVLAYDYLGYYSVAFASLLSTLVWNVLCTKCLRSDHNIKVTVLDVIK